MEYDRAARKRLGRAIRAARLKAGHRNRADFADQMDRSTRQVQALENGEDGVGPDTWAAAADALGWDVEELYAILDGTQSAEPVGEPSTVLAVASDEDLAAEVLRRMRRVGEQGGERDTPAIGVVGRAAAPQTDEERAAELGVSTVRPAQEEARRRRGEVGDENSDEGVTGG